jgi:hypothetical protein
MRTCRSINRKLGERWRPQVMIGRCGYNRLDSQEKSCQTIASDPDVVYHRHEAGLAPTLFCSAAVRHKKPSRGSLNEKVGGSHARVIRKKSRPCDRTTHLCFTEDAY